MYILLLVAGLAQTLLRRRYRCRCFCSCVCSVSVQPVSCLLHTRRKTDKHSFFQTQNLVFYVKCCEVVRNTAITPCQKKTGSVQKQIFIKLFISLLNDLIFKYSLTGQLTSHLCVAQLHLRVVLPEQFNSQLQGHLGSNQAVAMCLCLVPSRSYRPPWLCSFITDDAFQYFQHVTTNFPIQAMMLE